MREERWEEPGHPPPSRHILVLPDREAAEEVAEELTGLLALPPGEEPRPVREALAGDDDAEDAQWLVVLEDPERRHDTGALRELVESREGWLERE
ncbi:hypothetical protein [Streptomyces calidiresistens]|uniref:Uncharacterized protein n=1 Tax=Streptomyces calidiresistens TaxID=1485586 RepID=A0A7W3T752_9ACTN|nr:hypothetical protein [Streptomyces calidiresistens]MBB0232167.1 hypothetical protein [Streptomyces calidiresistens]